MKKEVGLGAETGCTDEVKLRFILVSLNSGSGDGSEPG